VRPRWRTVLESLAPALHDESYLNLQEAFTGGSIPQVWGKRVGKTKHRQEVEAHVDRGSAGAARAVHVESATPMSFPC
jgi:hypothetical protein